jgi:hypothetical protein
MTNDREAFEAYYARRTSCDVAEIVALRRGDDYTLVASHLQTLWEGWKARAALADSLDDARDAARYRMARKHRYINRAEEHEIDTLIAKAQT